MHLNHYFLVYIKHINIFDLGSSACSVHTNMYQINTLIFTCEELSHVHGSYLSEHNSLKYIILFLYVSEVLTWTEVSIYITISFSEIDIYPMHVTYNLYSHKYLVYANQYSSCERHCTKYLFKTMLIKFETSK